MRNGFFVEVAKTSAASCKLTGQKQVKGTLRFAIRTGPLTQMYVGLEVGAPIVREVLCAALAKPADIVGLNELDAENRKAVLKACHVSAQDRAAFDRAHPDMIIAAGATAAKKRKRA